MSKRVDHDISPHLTEGMSEPPCNQREWIVRLLVWLVSGEFKGLALGLFFVGFGLSELARQEFSILNWRQTQGTVVDSRTEWLEQKRGSFGPPITVRVRYRYTVDGKEYESVRITTGEPILFYTVQEAAAFRKRFPPGGQITVLYAPYAPSEATLIAARSSGPWILLGFGTPLLLLALYRLWQHPRLRDQR
jgi:hypothetical protein